MTIEVRQIREEDIANFHAAIDAVARERKYIALLEAPPIEQRNGLRPAQHRERLPATRRHQGSAGRRLVQYPTGIARSDGACRRSLHGIAAAVARSGIGRTFAAGFPRGGGCVWISAHRAWRVCGQYARCGALSQSRVRRRRDQAARDPDRRCFSRRDHHGAPQGSGRAGVTLTPRRWPRSRSGSQVHRASTPRPASPRARPAA